MEEQLNSPTGAEVIPINAHRGVERINHIRINLGRMSLDELETLAGHCEQRVGDAQLDLQVVREYIEESQPGEHGDAS